MTTLKLVWERLTGAFYSRDLTIVFIQLSGSLLIDAYREKRIRVQESFLPPALNEMSAPVTKTIYLYQSTPRHKIKTHLTN